ncbi:MAG: 3'-5' exonuclease [Labilithrix sp.]|nr:3'-5' exonuclease [Labilithrix sp.]MCW5810038.1 3'-5' exonuclease [Labilithrix sp.]
MTRAVSDGCGCFPTGRHYPGIAHLLKVVIRGLAEGFAADVPWQEIDVALLDVETTGRDASVDRVVEVGIVVGRNGEVVARYNWLIHPGMPIPAEVTAIHGITDEMVKDKPRFEEIAAEIAAALKGCVPSAYNALFDRAFMMSEFARAKADTIGVAALQRDVEWVDPLVWARDIQHDQKSRALGDVAERLGVKLEQAHRASDDAEAALRVMYALGRDPRVPRAYGALVQEQRRLSQAQADQRRMWRS